jgi:hypothetical protein
MSSRADAHSVTPARARGYCSDLGSPRESSSFGREAVLLSTLPTELLLAAGLCIGVPAAATSACGAGFGLRDGLNRCLRGMDLPREWERLEAARLFGNWEQSNIRARSA